MARRSIYSTRASDWVGSVLADDGRMVGAGSGLFVAERIEFGWIEPKAALVEASTVARTEVSGYALDTMPLVDVSARAIKPVADRSVGEADELIVDLQSVDFGAGEDVAFIAEDMTVAAASGLSFAAKIDNAGAAPLSAIERLARVADGDFLSMQTIDVFGASFMTPGADPFSKTSFQLIDMDGDGIDEFIVRLDEQGPILIGTDFLI